MVIPDWKCRMIAEFVEEATWEAWLAEIPMSWLNPDPAYLLYLYERNHA